MVRDVIKSARGCADGGDGDVRRAVRELLAQVAAGGDGAVRALAARFDRHEIGPGGPTLPPTAVAAAAARVPPPLRAAVERAHGQIRAFAQAQRATLQAGEWTLPGAPGLRVGQRLVPVARVGCYVPGGRFAHVASALMTVTAAREAGVDHIVVCSPPPVHDAIVFAAQLAGADQIVALGGVQAIGAMVHGLVGIEPVDFLAGPGNAYVAEAKRELFGRVGIDMIAGPTDSLLLADASADAQRIAIDLVSQAEHGATSPVWLVSTDRAVAERVIELVPGIIAELPELNRKCAEAAWRDFAEVTVVESRDEMAALSDEYAPEHLSVHCTELDWWLERLRNYGSLFLGDATTVSFGDKASGPSHVLPTSRAARYTGGLSVHKFIKILTYQRFDDSAEARATLQQIAQTTATISRAEGMVGHALAAEERFE